MLFKKFCSFFIVTFVLVAKPVISQSIIDDNQRELILRSLPDENGEEFLRILDENYDLFASFDIKSFLSILSGGKATNESCHACDTILRLGQSIAPEQASIDFVKMLVCSNDLGPTISKRECEGLIDRLGMPVLYIVHNTKVPLDQGCSVLVGHECSHFLQQPTTNWTFWELEMPEARPFKPIEMNEGKTRKVLHLTDVHLDLYYTDKSNSKCNEALCCRSTSFVIDNKTVPAGYWGEVNGDCDIPLVLVENSLQQIHASHPDIDLIFWTGDNVPHDVWNTSIESCLKHNQVVAQLIKKTFPNVPVLPALGNHEAHPINMYVPMEVAELTDGNHSTQWLYDAMADEIWSVWLQNDSIRDQFKKGGFYSKMMTPGWKVIVLNSNAGYLANFWRAYDPIDPDGQLAWLIEELDHAEQIGAMVTILGHIPPSNMYEAWLHNLIRIFDRYSHVITAAYNGHTHNDELAVLYNKQDKPVGVNFISGSLTTFSYLNPSYKIFELNERGQPLNYDVYFLYLDKTNEETLKNETYQPKWMHEFNAKQSYGLDDLSVEQWHKYLKEAEQNLDMSYTYAEHYHRHSSEYRQVNHFNPDKVKQLVKSIKTVSPFQKKTNEYNF